MKSAKKLNKDFLQYNCEEVKMKRIKRTITMRKVEITGSSKHIHESNIEICPLCHSPLESNEAIVHIPEAKLQELEIADDVENDLRN